MKREDDLAALLAAHLDGGPIAAEIEPLEPAVRALRQLLQRLAPDAEAVKRMIQSSVIGDQ